MPDQDFLPPVASLLTLGKPDDRAQEWPVYLQRGFKAEHVPELIRLATDADLSEADPDDPAVWAPLHAWRVLGQLRAAEAIEPLLQLLAEDDDWANAELPEVYARIGPAAVPVLASFLASPAHSDYARQGAASCLTRIAQEHDEAYDACVAILTDQLKQFRQNSALLNGDLVGQLIDLAATEAAPVMEAAFAGGFVDEWIAGDWDDVQVDLGLKEPDDTLLDDLLDEAPWDGYDSPFQPGPSQTPSQQKAKAGRKKKAKMAKASRKKNRKR